jgi:ribosome-binding protein aMBF1 (putative translation factor)
VRLASLATQKRVAYPILGYSETGLKIPAMSRSPMYKKLEQALQNARLNKQLTQTEVATKLGRPQSFVSKYESGERRLDVIEFLSVCDALGVRPTDMLKALGTG